MQFTALQQAEAYLTHNTPRQIRLLQQTTPEQRAYYDTVIKSLQLQPKNSPRRL